MKRDKQAEKVAYLITIGYVLRRAGQRTGRTRDPLSCSFLTLDDRRVWVDEFGRVSELRADIRDAAECKAC